MLAVARIQYGRSAFEKLWICTIKSRAIRLPSTQPFTKCLVAIKRKAYTDALKKLELLFGEQTQRFGWSRRPLAQGLQLMLNRYETAEKAFEVVAKSFERLKKAKMDQNVIDWMTFWTIIGAHIATNLEAFQCGVCPERCGSPAHEHSRATQRRDADEQIG